MAFIIVFHQAISHCHPIQHSIVEDVRLDKRLLDIDPDRT